MNHYQPKIYYCKSILYSVLIIAIQCIYTSYAQQNPGRMTLSFDQNGKMLSGYKIRYRPEADICDVYNSPTKIEVLIRADFLKDDKEKMDEIRNRAITALDSTTVLSQLLDNSIGTAIQQELSGAVRTHVYVPERFVYYDTMLTGLQRADISRLNSLKYLFPIKLMIGDRQLDTSCMHFEPYLKQDKVCNCLVADPRMVKLVFNVPHTIFSDNTGFADFRLKRDYPMKKAAIDYLKDLIGANQSSLPKLLNMEASIKSSAETIATGRQKLEEYLLLRGNCDTGDCPDIENRNDRANKLREELLALRPKLESGVGPLPYNCTTVDCLPNNNYAATILGCSVALKNWLAKLVWLNGDKISLNPFGFTLPSKLPKAKRDDKKSAQIKINFFDSAIVHLEDRIAKQNMENVGTNANIQAELDALLAKRKEAAAIVANDPDATDKNTVAENKKLYDGFATISQVLYKGQWEPYESSNETATAYEKDRLWLRHYYFDDKTILTRQKFHFTYPEDENLAVMVHNVPGNTIISLNEYYAGFKDSAAFTVSAGQAFGQIASLYASLNSILPLRALQWINNTTAAPSLRAPPLVTSSNENALQANAAEAYSLAITDNNPSRRTRNDRIESDTAQLRFYNGETRTFIIQPHIYRDSARVVRGLTRTIFNVITTQASLVSQAPLCMDLSTLAYLNALQQLAAAPPLIDKVIAAVADTTPLLSTFVHKLSDKEAPHQMGYKLQAQLTDNDGVRQYRFIDSSYVKVGKFHHFQFTAGLAFTNKAGNITSIDTSAGGFKINRDEDRFRLIAGLKIYPLGLYNLKNPSTLWKEFRWMHRISILVATGVPKPLENFYLGLGFDFLPGFTISSGVHLQQRNTFTIQNNQILDRNIGYRPKWFNSISLDPGLLVTAIKSLF